MTVSTFQLQAALWVVRAIDPDGNDATMFDRSLRVAATQGRFPREDLDRAIELLVAAALVTVDNDRVVAGQPAIALAALGDDAAVPLLARLIEQALTGGDAMQRALTGERGEQAVVQWCVQELEDLGRHDLVPEVVRVSVISDSFGYDVSAPTVGGPRRLLEVKTTATAAGKTFRFRLSRNEFDVGRRHPHQWAMVACVDDGEDCRVAGWCRAAELERYLPDDGNGRWTEAQVALPTSALMPGAPTSVL